MAPPNNSSFSVSVVFPASGWDMMANVRRLPISVWRLIRGARLYRNASSGKDAGGKTPATIYKSDGHATIETFRGSRTPGAVRLGFRPLSGTARASVGYPVVAHR